MKPQPPIKRPKEQQKEQKEKNEQKEDKISTFDNYKPRDWGYQNPKHQIRPEFVLGKSKKRLPEPRHNYFPSNESIYSPINNGWRRELKPAIYRSYILSQASTVPGAVIVEEQKIKDDKTKEERRKFVEKKNEELINKLMNNDLNIDSFLDYKKNKKLFRAKTQENVFKGHKINPGTNKKDDKEKVGEIKVNLKRSPRRKEKKDNN